MAADDTERAVVRMRSHRQQIRPVPVILPPLADELLSSWVNRHAAFIGMSGVRLLRHYHIEVPTIRDLDLKLTCRQAATLSDVLRCSPHFVRNMTQSRGGRVRSRLIAIRRPPQICLSCARRHDANAVTRGARLRSWMEGWRITCPICGTPLDEFRLFMRLIRADPADPLLVQNGCNARGGELIMDRASRRHGGGSDYAALMRSLLSRQAPRTTVREKTVATPRLLDLVVPGSENFFQRLAPENWPCAARLLPLSVRIPVLAGVAAVSRCPGHWIDKLAGAAAPPHRAGILKSVGALASSGRARQ